MNVEVLVSVLVFPFEVVRDRLFSRNTKKNAEINASVPFGLTIGAEPVHCVTDVASPAKKC